MTSDRGLQGFRPAALVRVGLRESGNATAMSQRAAQVQQSPTFSAFSLANRKEFVFSAREKTFFAGETVFLEGDLVQRISTNRDDHPSIGVCLGPRKIVASYLAALIAPAR